MTNHHYTLANRNGGFAILTKEEYKAWLRSPKQACETMPELLAKLHSQTLNRGFNYDDFTPHHGIEVLPKSVPSAA